MRRRISEGEALARRDRFRYEVPPLLLLGHFQLIELLGDVFAVTADAHVLIDVEDLPVFANVIGPAIGHLACVEAAECFCHFGAGVAQDWVI